MLSHSVVSDSLWPHGLYPTRFFCPWGFSRQEYWSGLPCPAPGHLGNPGIEPRSPTFQVDSLPSEPPGKPKNIGVGSLSLLQGSSQPRNQARVSWIAGIFFTSWATREACPLPYISKYNVTNIKTTCKFYFVMQGNAYPHFHNVYSL